MEQNKDQGGAAVRGEAVAEYQPGQWWLQELENHWGHGISNNDTKRAAKVACDFAAKVFSARAADAPSEPSEPTDLSHRLRETADQQPGWKQLLNAAADEIDRYYGGMLAWKKTAEQKDADWNAIVRAADALDSQPSGKPVAQWLRNNYQDYPNIASLCDALVGDALDSQPTEPDGLPPLPEPIEVGGEGWDFDDFKSEKTFSCEHMWAYARAAIASSQPTAGGVRNGQLMRFYSVETVQALIDAQEQHIVKLQAKLPRDAQPAFTRAREG